MPQPEPRYTTRPPAVGRAARAASAALLLLALNACGGSEPSVTEAISPPPDASAATAVPAPEAEYRGAAMTHADAEGAHEQAVHVHGEAELLVVTEAGQVEVRLESPAEALIGFEHPPRSPLDWQQAAAAMAALSAETVMTAGDADGPCERVGMTWSTPLFSAQALRTGAGPVGQEPRHDPSENHAEERHAGIDATWRFRCSGEPVWLEQRLLATFPGLQKLDVQLAAASSQRAWEIGERTPARFMLRAE